MLWYLLNNWRLYPNVTWVWIHIPWLSEHKQLLLFWSASSEYAELVVGVVVINVVSGVVYSVVASVPGFVDGHGEQSESDNIQVAWTILNKKNFIHICKLVDFSLIFSRLFHTIIN